MADSMVAAGNPAGNNHTGTAALYNPEEAGAKLKELDALVPQVSAALHQEKFQQVQVRGVVAGMGWGSYSRQAICRSEEGAPS